MLVGLRCVIVPAKFKVRPQSYQFDYQMCILMQFRIDVSGVHYIFHVHSESNLTTVRHTHCVFTATSRPYLLPKRWSLSISPPKAPPIAHPIASPMAPPVHSPSRVDLALDEFLGGRDGKCIACVVEGPVRLRRPFVIQPAKTTHIVNRQHTYCKTEQHSTEQNRTEQNRTEQNRAAQSRTEPHQRDAPLQRLED